MSQMNLDNFLKKKKTEPGQWKWKKRKTCTFSKAGEATFRDKFTYE